MKKGISIFILFALLLVPLVMVANAADQATTHTVEFRFPDNKVVAYYATFSQNESSHSKRFFAKSSVKFTNVESGSYYANFRLKSKQWVVPGEPEVDAEHRELNVEVLIRIDNGEWVRLTGKNTVKAYGKYWNLLIRIP